MNIQDVDGTSRNHKCLSETLETSSGGSANEGESTQAVIGCLSSLTVLKTFLEKNQQMVSLLASI